MNAAIWPLISAGDLDEFPMSTKEPIPSDTPKMRSANDSIRGLGRFSCCSNHSPTIYSP